MFYYYTGQYPLVDNRNDTAGEPDPDSGRAAITDPLIEDATDDEILEAVPEQVARTAEPLQDAIPALPAVKWMDIGCSNADTVSHMVTGLDSGKVYHFWVRAVSQETRGVSTADSMKSTTATGDDALVHGRADGLGC